MWDIHHERLKHLVSTAILELWKKETGSLSSVLIEGTVCITAGSGRTTILQLSDRFAASIPENREEEERKRNFYAQRRDSFYGSRHVYGPPLVDCKQENNASNVQAYFDELSPASLSSPTEIPLVKQDAAGKSRKRTSGEREIVLSNKSGLSPMDSGIGIVNDDRRPMELSITQLKDEFLSDEESDSLNSSRNSATGPIIPGTGYYTFEGHKKSRKFTNNASKERGDISSVSSEKESDENEDSVIEDKSTADDFSVSDGNGPLISTPKHTHNKPPFFADSVNTSKLNILDLRKRELVDDLALSPPQNYTAQVRDVIRQRLLASTGRTTSLEESEMTLDDSKLDIKGNPQTLSIHSDKSLLELNNLPRFSPNSVYNGPTPLHSPARRPSSVPFPAFITSSPTVSPSPQIKDMFTSNSRSQIQMSQATALSQESKSVSPVDSLPSMLEADAPQQGENLTKEVITTSAGGEQKVYKCDFCSKTFLFKSKYHEHLPVHTNARPYQCRLCSRTYKYKYDLRVHLRTHMGIPTKSTVCPFCNAKFDTNKLLRLHIKDAHRERHRVTEEDCAQMYESVL